MRPLRLARPCFRGCCARCIAEACLAGDGRDGEFPPPSSNAHPPPPPPQLPTLIESQSAWTLWRDFLFLLLATALMKVVFMVETNPGGQAGMLRKLMEGSPSMPFGYGWDFLGGSHVSPSSPPYLPPPPTGTGIVDSGFQITSPLHSYLASDPLANDVYALLNTVGLLFMVWYPFKCVLWEGDYTCAFRMVSTQVRERGCGDFSGRGGGEFWLLFLREGGP